MGWQGGDMGVRFWSRRQGIGCRGVNGDLGL